MIMSAARWKICRRVETEQESEKWFFVVEFGSSFKNDFQFFEQEFQFSESRDTICECVYVRACTGVCGWVYVCLCVCVWVWVCESMRCAWVQECVCVSVCWKKMKSWCFKKTDLCFWALTVVADIIKLLENFLDVGLGHCNTCFWRSIVLKLIRS